MYCKDQCEDLKAFGLILQQSWSRHSLLFGTDHWHVAVRQALSYNSSEQLNVGTYSFSIKLKY